MGLPRHVITLKGNPEQNEDGAAGAAIMPGMVVSGTLTILPHTGIASAGKRRTVALERQEMGDGINVPYAIGDRVKVASYRRGDRFYGLVATGATAIPIDAPLKLAAGGTLALSTDPAVDDVFGTALEALTNVSGSNARLRVEVQ